MSAEEAKVVSTESVPVEKEDKSSASTAPATLPQIEGKSEEEIKSLVEKVSKQGRYLPVFLLSGFLLFQFSFHFYFTSCFASFAQNANSMSRFPNSPLLLLRFQPPNR